MRHDIPAVLYAGTGFFIGDFHASDRTRRSEAPGIFEFSILDARNRSTNLATPARAEKRADLLPTRRFVVAGASVAGVALLQRYG